jgi:neutral trehalase
MWVEPGKFEKCPIDTRRHHGFRNYAWKTEQPIAYGDLSAEVFPLFVGLATLDQAIRTMKNLKRYYEGDIGLASTSLMLRIGGPLASEPLGWTADKCQWEVNAWPPLMMIAIEGLRRYGDKESNPDIPDEHRSAFTEYAQELEKKWVAWLESYFKKHKRFSEKTPFDSAVPLSEGFYGNLPGFGWTIASYVTCLQRLAKEDKINWKYDDLDNDNWGDFVQTL